MTIQQVSKLSPLDSLFVKIYIRGCMSDWEKLPPLAKELYAQGGTTEQLRGCLRHLIVLAGYGPCLAAHLTLQKAKLLAIDTPGKIGGPPGNAFDVVYTTVAPAVRKKVHSADTALGYWIENHLYGDIYSSPGLDLRRKQLVMCARLAQANMGEQLFGHALAALRFGNTKEELAEAIEIAFQLSVSSSARIDDSVDESSHTLHELCSKQKVYREATKILDLAQAKYAKDYSSLTACNVSHEVFIPDPASIRIPTLEECSAPLMASIKQQKTLGLCGKDIHQEAEISIKSHAGELDSLYVKKQGDIPYDAGTMLETGKDDDGIKFSWELLNKN